MATHRLLRAAFLAALVPVAAIAVQAQGHGNPDRPIPALAAEPPMLGLHQVRGEAGKARPGGGGASPNMVWHNGAIMPRVTVKPIFWGPSWSNAGFYADKLDGLHAWHTGIGNSSFADTTNEYTGTGGAITSQIDYSAGYLKDTVTPVPSTVSKLTTPTASEVCKVLNGTAAPDGSGYYPVYVDVKRGNAGFCAYHSYTTCDGVPVQFAFFFNLDGDAGCDPQDASGLHSEGLAALVNVSAHELSEARTDPRNGGWYDNSGAENADKCAWTFGTDLITLPANGTKWKMQGNWSNAAYNANKGYTNSSKQNGCIDGGNFLKPTP